MPSQPPIMPRIAPAAQAPGALYLTAAQLELDDLVIVINQGALSAVTTIQNLMSLMTGRVQSETANFDVEADENGTEYDNNGAVGSVTGTLPTGQVGLGYGFALMENQTFVIQAPTGVTIYNGDGFHSTAGGTMTSSTKGSYIFLRCHSTTEWLAESAMGTWNPA